MTTLAAQAVPASQLTLAITTAVQVKSLLETVNADSLAGPIARHRLISVMAELSRAITRFTAVAATPGIVQYAKDQFDDQLYDIGADITAINGAITTLRDWVFSNFPKDAGSGAWLVSSFAQDGAVTELTFSTATLAQYRTNSAAVIAALT